MTLTPQRLKRLVAYRERLEQVQEGKLGTAQRAHQQREQSLARTQEIRQSLFATGAPVSGAFDPTDLELTYAYIGRLERDIGATSAALVHSANAVAFERGQLLIRRKDRKAMETLLDRVHETERLAAQHQEQRTLDEIALRDWHPLHPYEQGK